MALTQISTGGVKNDAVTAGKIPANAVGSSEIADDAVGAAQIADGGVGYAAVAAEAIDEARLKISNAGTDGQFLSKQSGDLGGLTWADAITAIADDSITQAKIADDAIGQDQLAENAVLAANLTNDCVTADKIADEAIAESRLEISNAGTNGQYLQKQSGNTGGLTWADVSSAPEITGTTDGAVTAGDPIIATSEGKLAKVEAYTKTAGTPGVANDSYRGNIQVAYDKISGKVAVANRESSKISIAVGTISGTTVTWGSEQDVTTDATDPFAVGFHNNVLLVGYRNSGAKARVATVSGTTISTFGSEASISTSGNPYMRYCFYSEVSERWVLQWHNSSNYPNYTQLVVGTISGTTFSFGSIQDCFDSTGIVDRPGIREMPSVGKIVVFGIQDYYPEHRFQTRVGTIDTSDNSVDWETQQEYEWFGVGDEFDYYGTEQDCDLAWHDDGKYAIAVARKGTSNANEQKPYALKLSYNESTKVFSYNASNKLLLQDELVSNCMNAIYVPDTKEIMAWWVDRTTSNGNGWIRWKTIKSSGEYTLQFVDPVSSSTNGNQVGANANTSGGPDHTGQNSVYAGAGRVIFGYRDNSQSNKTYTAIQQLATTNAASQEFIGFASSSVGDNASLTVKVTGNTLTTSNLTAGKKHYVQNNGSLSTSPDTPSIEAGIALSSTKLLIKG